MPASSYTPFAQEKAGGPALPYEHIQTSPTAFGGAEGAAAEKLGGGLVRAGETGLDVATQAEALHNEAQVNDAQSKFLGKMTEVLYKPESADGAGDGGFYTKRGDNAGDAYEGMKTTLAAAREEAGSGLANDRQRTMFNALTRKMYDYGLQDMGRHVDREISQAADKKTESALSTLGQSATLAASSGNMPAFDQAVSDGVATAKSWGERRGYGKEWGDAWAQKWVGQTVGNSAKQMIQNGDLAGASTLVSHYAPDMDKDSLLSVKTALKGKLQDKAASDFAKNVVWGVTQPVETGDMIQSVSDRITAPGGPEGTGKNPRSSAEGTGQFTASTWLETVKRARPDIAGEKSDAELLAMRNNPEFARSMTQNLTAQNAATLSDAGLPATPGNIYLAHFAGPTGAIKTLSADDATPISAVLSQDAIKANPEVLGGNKTVADLKNWANLQMAGVGPRAAVKFDKASAITTALAAFSDDPAMRTKAVSAINQQFAAVQLDAAARAQAQTEMVNKARDGYVKQMMGGDFSPALVQGIQNDPSFNADPSVREHLWTMATTHAQTALGHDPKTYGQGFYDLFQRVHAPPGAEGRITDVKQLMPLVTAGGPLTLSGYEKLSQEIAGKRTPDGEAESAMKKKFFDMAQDQITKDPIGFKDPKGKELNLRFMAQAWTDYNKGKENGLSAAQMLDPKSSDYIGKSIGSFVRPMAQRLKDLVPDDPIDEAAHHQVQQGEAAATEPDLTTKDGIRAAFQAGKITREDARKRLSEGGHFAPAPTAADLAPPMAIAR